MTAQRASEEIRESARKEAEIAIGEAELQAEKIVQGAHQRFLRIVDDINELKRQRVQFEASVRALVEGHAKLLETFRDPTWGSRSSILPGGRRGGGVAPLAGTRRAGAERLRQCASAQSPPFPTSTSSGTGSSAAPSISRRTSASDRPRPPAPATSSTSSSWTCRSSGRRAARAASAAVHPEHGDLDDVGGRPLDGRVDRHPLGRLAQAGLRDRISGMLAPPPEERPHLARLPRRRRRSRRASASPRRSGRSSGR